MDTFKLEFGSTRVVVADPRAAEPYYRGTRFDRTGIILSLESGGHRYVQPWQRHYDPYSHDAVSGPAEEFLPPVPVGLVRSDTEIRGADSFTPFGECAPDLSASPQSPNSPSPTPQSPAFVKIGVGLLRDDGEPYDRFKLYDVLDPGEMTVTLEPAGQNRSADAVKESFPDRDLSGFRNCAAAGPCSKAVFRHTLSGRYDYVKTVEIPAEGCLRLTHALRNDGPDPIDTYVYCHNFFILDGAPTGRATRFEFPFQPVGDWRAPYDSVRLTERGIAFDRDLGPSETVYMGNLTAATAEGYRFTLRNLENGLHIEAACDRAMDHAVFWSNPDVSCLEPYIPIHLDPGQTARWTLDYRFL